MSRYRHDVLKTIRVRGEKYEISVNSDGEFTAHVAGDYLRETTLAELLKKIKRSANKRHIEVAIPAMLSRVNDYTAGGFHERKFKGITCKPITLIGVETNYMQVKYRDWDGKVCKHERGGHGEEKILKPMTPDQVKKWAQLYKAKNDAATAFYEYEKPFVFEQPYSAVKDALNAAVDTPVEPPEESDDPR